MFSLETKLVTTLEQVLHAVRMLVTQPGYDRRVLLAALDELREAKRADPNYLLPPIYIAMIEDRLSHTDAAIAQLEEILNGLGDHTVAMEDIRLEANFSLLVAKYHQYTVASLKQAEDGLLSLLQDVRLYKHKRLSWHIAQGTRWRSHAVLAQVYATQMISQAAAVDHAERARIRECYDLAMQQIAYVLRWRLQLPVLHPLSRPSRYVQALARNARGLAAMYYTDYFSSQVPGEDAIKLRSALADLEADSDIYGNDPALVCDRASCEIRLARKTIDPGEQTRLYESAQDKLITVVYTLWPDYGFAYFELGRIHRLRSNFTLARDYFERAAAVPAAEREVTVGRINHELQLVADGDDRSFP